MEQKHTVRVEELGLEIGTGSLANLANGSVTLTLGETTLFASACAAKSLRPGQDFFPLTVDYREKFAAAGRFPGGYFKREARPTEKEILTSRLCDRPLRPLFPKGFMNEVQVIGMALSIDGIHEPDILMVNAASAALMVSDIPWNGPVGCVRVAEIDGEFVANPTQDQMFDSTLDLIYVGNEKEMMMIEGSADFISKERFQEALRFGQEKIQPIVAAQKELAAKVTKAKSEFELYVPRPEILALCRELSGSKLEEAIFIADKQSRGEAVGKIKEEVSEAVKEKVGEEDFDPDQISLSFEVLQEEVYRSNILEKGKRADGRAPGDLREISATTGVLPKVHGTSIFNRGETQALVYATLGTSKDTQELDALTGGASAKSFYLHYNFPPYSVGETGRFGFTGRREIGHGALAERSLLPIIPTEEEFPYAIRVVSEIMGSNGSTSMASICGGCLALMDAGVPITGMVAGISAGLVTDMDESGAIKSHKVLTDIIGAEDHFGDMDFKIAGTKDGITGFQLDLKIQGLPFDIADEAIEAATEARLKILDKMAEAMPAPRSEINPNAPRIHSMKIDPDKIGALIGPGGKNIRRIQELTGADIDINEDNSGRLLVFAQGADTLKRAIEEIDLCTAEIEVGRIYKGIVRGVKDFGAFVECLPGKEGLCHISELADFRVAKTEDVAKLGDELVVKCIGIDDKGRVKLSRKAAMAEAEGGDEDES
ncbi:MAG: polyribonucleotide nucleotidyltransferase [Verrucomicrobiota bacterium]